MSYREPRPLADALSRLTARLAPATTLARVQACWADVVGPAIAEEAEPVAGRDGTITVACRSSVWASELDLLSPRLIEGLNDALGEPVVGSFRFVVRGGR